MLGLVAERGRAETGSIACVAWPSEQPVLTGEAVVLRAVMSTDADSIHRACQDPDIQHFTQVPVPYHRADAEAFVRVCRARWLAGTTANFAVCDRRTGELLGVVGVVGADHVARTAGLGYWTAAWGRGRGATTQAVRLATAWALGVGGLAELTAEAETANPASMRVLAKAGFVRDADADEVVELKGSLRTFSIWRAMAKPWSG